MLGSLLHGNDEGGTLASFGLAWSPLTHTQVPPFAWVTGFCEPR